MDKNKLPVSVCISTLNAATHLRACLESVFANRPAEVIIIDGESIDETVEIAESFDVKIIRCEAKGLAYQRQQGLNASTQPFMALVDAHHCLAPDCLDILLHEMEKFSWKAIQASLSTVNKDSYWIRAMNTNETLSLSNFGSTNMVGRPCIYEIDAIRKVGFDPFFSFGVGNEDSDVSIGFEEAGFSQGIGTGKAFHHAVGSFKEWWRKWKSYGRGDAHLIAKYPYKKWQIIKHILWEYPIKRAFKSLIKGKGIYIPFFILFGWIRFAYYLKEANSLRSSPNRDYPRY